MKAPRWDFRKRWAWAQAKLLRLGYHPGLGLAEYGIRYPISLPTLLGTFGLGFDPKVHFGLRTSHCEFKYWTWQVPLQKTPRKTSRDHCIREGVRPNNPISEELIQELYSPNQGRRSDRQSSKVNHTFGEQSWRPSGHANLLLLRGLKGLLQ